MVSSSVVLVMQPQRSIWLQLKEDLEPAGAILRSAGTVRLQSRHEVVMERPSTGQVRSMSLDFSLLSTYRLRC